MPELTAWLGAVAGGVACAVVAFAIVHRPEGTDAASWLAHRYAQQTPAAESRRLLSKALNVSDTRLRLASLIDRAGWNVRPERLAISTAALSGSLVVLGVASSSVVPTGNAAVLGGLGLIAGIGCMALVLRSAIAARQRRLAAELVPLLELFTLELGGGGNAVSALGTVTARVRGELAADLRRLLIAAQVAGSAPFESRLMQYADHLDIRSLASLATILAASREYGTGVVHGVRALATDLRHAQRRDLIVHSRRALNHVLIPAAVGVLLPFLAIIMFPAVTALQRNLR
jgi:pilus assembly protein TadC